MNTFIVVFDGVKGAGGVAAVSKVTSIPGLTAMCVQMLPQVYQVFTAENHNHRLTNDLLLLTFDLNYRYDNATMMAHS